MGRPADAKDSGQPAAAPSFSAPASLATACPATVGAADRMAYMADLLRELAEMASAEGHLTLAGLLTLAHREADAKSRDR